LKNVDYNEINQLSWDSLQKLATVAFKSFILHIKSSMYKESILTCHCHNLKLVGESIPFYVKTHIHVQSFPIMRISGFEIQYQEEFGFLQAGIASFDLICFKCQRSFQINIDCHDGLLVDSEHYFHSFQCNESTMKGKDTLTLLILNFQPHLSDFFMNDMFDSNNYL
jgi:hypothetical protein